MGLTFNDDEGIEDGQIIEKNGKKYEVSLKEITPIIGPLGGTLRRIGDLSHREMNRTVAVVGSAADLARFLPDDYLVETNIPPSAKIRMVTASEASHDPDIIGKWIGVKVEGAEPECEYQMPLKAFGNWMNTDEKILLIEGVDLP